MRLLVAAVAAFVGTQAVSNPDGQIVKSEKQLFRMDVVARGLETPWALAFLPDGRLLVTERPGRLRVVANGKLDSAPVSGLPKVWEKQDGGLFDVEVHPRYSQNGWIYLAYSESMPATGPGDPPSMTVIVRGRLSPTNSWVDQRVLFRAPASIYNSRNAHYGCRFIFDRDNHLFFSIGDKQEMMDAQDLSKPTGKIHRVNDDGSIPNDNPFIDRPGALGSIWSYGHRNPQGFAWDPVTGKLWASEHGPRGGDEVNVIERGRNYGWGVITMGTQEGITKQAAPGMEQPVVFYTPSVGPSGMTFYTGSRYPGWSNQLFVAMMAGQQLRRLETKGDAVVSQEAVFTQFGRVRDVVVGPDGYVYVALQTPGERLSDSTPGTVARLMPITEK